jgi:hypothetical protein
MTQRGGNREIRLPPLHNLILLFMINGKPPVSLGCYIRHDAPQFYREVPLFLQVAEMRLICNDQIELVKIAVVAEGLTQRTSQKITVRHVDPGYYGERLRCGMMESREKKTPRIGRASITRCPSKKFDSMFLGGSAGCRPGHRGVIPPASWWGTAARPGCWRCRSAA